MPDSPASIAMLRRMVADLTATGSVARTAEAVDDRWLQEGLTPGQMHEIHALDAIDAPVAIGFAVALMLSGGAMPALWVRTERDERRAGRLHAAGLTEFGLRPRVVVVVADEMALLRVAADAARCPALKSVVIETHGAAPGLDLTATRRLMLAAEGSGVTVLSVRIGGTPVPTAAATRWAVTAAPSIPLEGDAPGLPAFDVECLRRRGGPAGARTRVEWNRDSRCFFPITDGVARGQAPLAGAGVPVAAGGAAARNPPASVRRTG